MILVKRLATSAVLITLIVSLLFGAGAFMFSVLVFLFSLLALYEFFTLLRAAKIPCYRLFGSVMGAIIPVVVYLEQGSTRSGEVLFLILGCLFLFFNLPLAAMLVLPAWGAIGLVIYFAYSRSRSHVGRGIIEVPEGEVDRLAPGVAGVGREDSDR